MYVCMRLHRNDFLYMQYEIAYCAAAGFPSGSSSTINATTGECGQVRTRVRFTSVVVVIIIIAVVGDK